MAAGFSETVVNIAGAGYTGVNPPDTVGDVGLNHYLQMINGSGGALLNIYDKSGALLSGPTAVDSLGTGNCANGLGDPIVLYDEAADRWMMSEFSNAGNEMCVYVSQTADPQGAWHAYQFLAPSFPDYPKYGVWHDAYYVGTNETQTAVYALERDKMLLGEPATMIRRVAADLWGSFDVVVPADFDGTRPPPADAPAYFLRQHDDELLSPGSANNSEDYLEVWAFAADFDTPANSTFSKIADISLAEFSSYFCAAGWFCVEQQGSSTKLDNLREPIMWRVQYRNFGDYQSLVANFVVNGDGAGTAAIRWFELRTDANGGWALYQEGTFAPDSQNYYWMGSAALDQSGNLTLGYSVSGDTLYPSLGYAGRLVADPLGQMGQGAHMIVTGTAPSLSGRWGDYSALGVDPADGCTFWFTSQYMASSVWGTQIASFRFPHCGESSVAADFSPNESLGLLGTTLTRTVVLTNVGDLTGTFDLTTVSEWTSLVSPTSVTLLPNEMASLVLSVTIPLSATNEMTATTALKVTNELGDEQLFTVVTEADLSGDLEWVAPAAFEHVTAGQSISHTNSLVNTSGEAKTFSLQATGNFSATIAPPTVTLASGASALIVVTIDVPLDVSDPSEAVVITATSQDDSSQYESWTYALDVTRLYYYYYPLFFRSED